MIITSPDRHDARAETKGQGRRVMFLGQLKEAVLPAQLAADTVLIRLPITQLSNCLVVPLGAIETTRG